MFTVINRFSCTECSLTTDTKFNVAPSHWYTVANEGTIAHFCSTKCLLDYIKGRLEWDKLIEGNL